MDYHHKYLKYRYKYFSLINELDDQIGGMKLFYKEQMLYIVATISDRKLKKVAKQITDTIIAKNKKPYRAPHITLYQIFIDGDNPDSKIFHDSKFYRKVKKIYDQTIANKDDPLILESYRYPRDYSLVGRFPGHFIRNYRQINPYKILDFRNGIIGLLEDYLGKASVKDLDEYCSYSFHGRELFLVPQQHYQKWNPHLNFLNTFDIDRHNPKLQKKLGKYQYSHEKVQILVDQIENIPQDTLEYIDMGSQMKNMTYALREGNKELLTVKFN